MISYVECSARERLAHLLDAGSFHEWLPVSTTRASRSRAEHSA